LETQGLLESSWRVESDRPRRYYLISAEGRKIFPQLIPEWKGLVAMVDGMLK
jgi:DNA-binding PadR family transcriptional regulator